MDRDYERIGRAIRFIEDNWQDQPELDAVADAVDLSPFHLQRLFQRWAGVSPKRFLQALTVDHAKALLDRRINLLDTSFEVGLSGPSRLHDLFVAVEGMTPGQYKAQGAEMTIRYGLHDSVYGRAIVGMAPLGICALEFTDNGDEAAVSVLQARFPLSRLVRDDSATEHVVRAMEEGTATGERLLLKGTNFQLKVWRALIAIPEGRVSTYGEVAVAIGHPDASRAVGAACGRNRVGILIPCHRVIGASGALTGFFWGQDRKRAILAREALRAEQMALAS